MDARRRTSYRPILFVGIVTATAGSFLTRRSLARATTSRATRLPIRQTACATSPFQFSSPSKPTAKSNMYGTGTGVTVPSQRKATAAIIFLHGLGDTGHGWASAFPWPSLPHMQTILPTAATIPVSLNSGMPMPSWFDLHGLDENSREDEAGILSAVARVETIIDDVVANGIPAERVVVAGFSQGGAVAITTALRTSRRLAGVVALSTWVPLRTQYPEKLAEGASRIPFFHGHGVDDQVVPFRFGKLSGDYLKQNGINVTMKQYTGMAHSACQAELDDVREFVGRHLPPL